MTGIETLPDAQAAARWLAQHCHGHLRSDSRAVCAGEGFLAWPGLVSDGRRYVEPALLAGAGACLIEAEGAQPLAFSAPARVAALVGLKSAAGAVADEFYGHPSRRLAVLAVTGTNGKTSSAWWLAQALSSAGRRCAMIGTLGAGQPPALNAAGLTTPDAVALQDSFARFVAEGFSACAIEASSIGIVEGRLAGTQVQVALFTNFTRDHLDYHADMGAYWAAKRSLFGDPQLRAAVVNVDDARGVALAEELSRRSGLDLWTLSCGRKARLRAEHIRYVDGSLGFDVVEGDERHALRCALIGEYNVQNLLGVLGGLRAVGLSLAQAAATVAHLTPVPGRMQRVTMPSQRPLPQVVVDYAHTPDALDKALVALRPLAAAQGGRLWCVFGCGGDRDASKRPLMGCIAARRSDSVVITSDNPRSEPPQRIIDQILVGARAAAKVPLWSDPDRRLSIAHAVRTAAPEDVILIAGKGHEPYQEIAGERLAFSDVAEAVAALEVRA